MLPTYRMLLEYDLSILVFSGDVDAIVPVSSHHIVHNPRFFAPYLSIPQGRTYRIAGMGACAGLTHTP